METFLQTLATVLSSSTQSTNPSTNPYAYPNISLAYSWTNLNLYLYCRWKNRTSLITPKEDVFYLVAFLSSAMPSSNGKDGLENILTQNKRILDFCTKNRLGMKQYLPHYSTQKEWRSHFGLQWEIFVRRKSTYDPLAVLAPGQRIFQKAAVFS